MRLLRDYQIACNEALRSAFRRGRKRVLAELATALGKGTIIAMMVKMAREKGKRVIVLVNRDILVEQLLNELKFNGVFAQREQAKDRACLTADVVVASVQSLNSKWLGRWPKDTFGFCITDEVHFSASKTFKAILDHFASAFHVGVTATAERHDKAGLWSGYEEISFRMPLKTITDKETGEIIKGGIDEGWLSPFDFHELDIPVTLDEKLQRKAVFAENEEVFDSRKYLPRIATGFVEAFEGRKSLVFTTNCRVSNQLSELIRVEGVDCKHVDSSYMSDAQTDEILAWFAESKNGILSNAQLLKYGYNMPDIQCIGLARPIGSEVDYKQILGRGSRVIADVDSCANAEERKLAIANSSKPNCKIVSLFWENGSHNLASPSCLITDDKDEREALDKKRKPGQQVDLAQLELQLKAHMDGQAEEMRKYAEKVANSQARKQNGKLYIADILKHRNPNHKIASDAFVCYVRKLGAEIPSGEVYSAYQIMRIKERIQKMKAA